MKRAVIHVSPEGSDRNSGTASQPVSSFQAALALARQAGPGRPREIVVHGGEHFDVFIEIGPEDSGLVIRAAPDERPVLYGGRPVSGWVREPNGWFSAELPGVKERVWDFRSLLVNGRFADRARFPASGSIRHESVFDARWMSSTKGGWDRKPTEEELTTLRYRPETLPPDFDPANAELTIYHSWDESLVGVASVDRKAGIMKFSTPAGHPPGAFGSWKEQARTFVMWNTREGMTRPGQWYLDRTRGRLVYWPLEKEDMAHAKIIAPARFCILRIAGRPEQRVEDVCLRGLTFSSTTTPTKAGGFGGCAFEGAVEAEHARGLRLENVRIAGAGGWAARALKSDGTLCLGCEIEDTGAGGLNLDGIGGRVFDTLICRPGLTYPSAIALRVHGENWLVQHNEIHHTPYSAIAAGGRRLRIERNLFHNVMEQLVDGAAVYIFAGKECLVRGNYTHSVRDEQVHAYYLDEQSEDSRVEGNLAEGAPWALHMHMARRCVLRNNICVASGTMTFSLANCEDFALDRNILSAGGELRFSTSYSGIGTMRRNIFWSGSGQIRWDMHDRLSSLERNSGPVVFPPLSGSNFVADPRMEIGEGGRIRFLDGSIAPNLGIEAPNLAGVGRRKNAKA